MNKLYLLVVTIIMLVPGTEVRGEDLSCFLKASPALSLSFPRDHGAHPKFQTEWWYFTGQLTTETHGNLFDRPADYGFQLTFFRREDTCDAAPIYLAHAAITDIRTGEFLFEKRMGSDTLGLSGSSTTGLSAWNLDWRAESVGNNLTLKFSLSSKKSPERTYELRLIASPSGDPVLQGERGYSRKAHDEGHASMYYSYPRLALKGEIIRSGVSERVTGLGWMDHEYMSNALQLGQTGWDWFSIMLKDGRELMLFRVRDRDPAKSYYSGTLIERGKTTLLTKSDFKIIEVSAWKSSRGVTYPGSWKVSVPQHNIELSLAPLLPDQELYAQNDEMQMSYWEGAVRANDGSAIGYVELTGYDKALDVNL